jgi:hypothetical protein
VPAEQRLQRNGRLQRKPEKRYSARTERAESEQSPEGAPDSEQWLSGGPSCQSSNGRTLTVGWRGWCTGQCPVAHQTVWCAPRQTASPTVILVGGAINTPQPPHFKASKFSVIAFNTRALDFTPRHKIKDQILSKVPISFQRLSGLWERHLCSFEFLSLRSLFFFLYSCSQATCNQRKRHQVVWSLWGV